MQHTLIDNRTSSFHFACDLYNLLPNPSVLPCGKANTWLLELGIGPFNHLPSDPSFPPLKQGKGDDYTAYAELTLWDSKTNQSAATHYTHRLYGYGGLSLSSPAASTSAKSSASKDFSSSKMCPEATKSLDLGFTVITAIVSTFADASLPGYFTPPPGRYHRDVPSTSSSKSSSSTPLHSPVAPYIILVHDRSLADLLTYLFSNEGAISPSVIVTPPLFSSVPLLKTKTRKYLRLPDGTNSQIPVICAHCKMLGVSNSGTLDGDFKTLLRCSSCGTAWYCSRECQRADWADGHKWDCAEGKGKEVRPR